ncbi:hypothetical protein MRX96_047685 [Rhipicephalus microplus]
MRTAHTGFSDLRSHPICALWKPLTTSSLPPPRVIFAFLSLACLLGKASCSKAHHCGLPFWLHFTKGLTPFCVGAHHCAEAEEEWATDCISPRRRETYQQSPDPPWATRGP